MSVRRPLAGLLLPLLLCAALPHAMAETGPSIEECRDRVIVEMSTVHDIYRSHLFGSREDDDGKFIANTGGEVDDARMGIFETRYRQTAELIWPIIESYRVMRCQSLYVCKTMEMSFNKKDSESDEMDMHILGCAATSAEPYDECKFAGRNLDADANTLTGNCQQLVEDTLSMEQGILRLAVGYDAGYRASLQFVGMTDWMMKDFPKRAFIPLRGMVNMLGKLYEIPCFLGQCDMPDNSDVILPGNGGIYPP